MFDGELIAFVRRLGYVEAALLAFVAPFVVWAAVRLRRAGRPVRGPEVSVGSGAYRGGAVRPLLARGLPWVVYAALLASGMGTLFVPVAVAYELATRGTLVGGLPAGAFHTVGVLGCVAARPFQLAAVLATLRRAPAAPGRTRVALWITAVSSAVYVDWIARVRLRSSEWLVELVDGALYLGGLAGTALLAHLALRAMERVERTSAA